MLQAGALDSVDAIFAGHVTTEYPVGRIMVSEGTITAHSDRFCIEVRGESGHGARPHEAVDAVLVTGLLITSIQSLVSRYVNPIWPSVVTVGQVHAGTAANIIAGYAVLDGIVRTTRPDVRRQIIEGLERTASALCTAIMHEAVELQRTTNWKWWKAPTKFNKQEAREELIDIWHFVIQASIELDLTPEDIIQEYKRKNDINRQRQRDGY